MASQYLLVGRFILVLAAVFSILIGHVSSHHGRGRVKHVQSGQRIQTAINAAHRGDRIFVEAGTYAEQLTIETDGIALIGSDAILIPPPSPIQNTCSGLAGPDTQAGICVTGSGVDLAAFQVEHRKVLSVTRPVQDVLISGFQVRNFSGENIAVVGGHNAHVTRNELVDGAQYGFLTAGSKGTRAHDNVVTSTSNLLFIGMCMDDMANAAVFSNHISGYYVGLCVQTDGADVRMNTVRNTCNGVFVDPGVKGAKVRRNHISTLNPACPKELPAGGVFVDGAVNTKVEQNVVEGLTNGGTAVGIAIIDDPTTTPVSIASGNVIDHNILFHNDVDIYVNTTGTGNVIVRNLCSTPEEYCKHK
ncbi:pectin lyase-like protein [Rhizodiscina lignyota]|uniref:Pectin lyase-like protein n=1 Tax=Rhizodiscina lignyota TaxID=1504668 RepID=A0A9P4IRX8_9PEZI|nr:pectin lyase-like protein [Rhizodiscina lignyota]